MARSPRLITPTAVVTVISGGLLLMLAAIEFALAAMASPACLIVGITMLCRISAPPAVSKENDTSLLILVSIALGISTPLPGPHFCHEKLFTGVAFTFRAGEGRGLTEVVYLQPVIANKPNGGVVWCILMHQRSVYWAHSGAPKVEYIICAVLPAGL